MGRKKVNTAAGSRWKRLAVGGLSLVVAAASVPVAPARVLAAPVAIQNEAEPLASASMVASPLLITEIVADTHQADQTITSGTDAFEYVEITNVSTQSVNLDSYLIQNVNGSTITDWEIPEGMTLAAGETLVVWIRNAESDSLAEEDFRTYYGISQDVQLVKTVESVNGFSNSGERSIRIQLRATGQTVTQITYNDGDQKAQIKKGITFGYTLGQVQQNTLSYDGKPTPGAVEEGQMPSAENRYQVSEQAGASVTVTADSSVDAGSSFTITASTDLTALVQSASVEVELASGTESYSMDYDNGSFTATIPASDLEGVESFSYQVTLSDGVNTVSSELATVTVNQDTEEPELAAPLVVTEIVPNTDNVDGSDAYEFVELYNAGEQTVNLDDYSFLYDNGTTVTEWQLTQTGMTLDAGECLVVWIRNEASLGANETVDDFNAYYGTSFTDGGDLAQIESGGFSNSGSRSFSVCSQTGTTFSTVTYTAGDSSNGSLDVDEAIRFAYNGEEITTLYDGDPTPGSLAEANGQTIRGQYTAPAAVSEPSVTATAPAAVQEGGTWTVSVTDTNLTASILRAEVRFYVTGAEEPAMTLPMAYEDGTLQASVSYSQIQAAASGIESFEYEVMVTDGVNTAVSARSTVTVGEQGTVDASRAPALVITELLPDSSNTNGADAYEFIELYNNSNQDIDLKDYKLYYNYPDNGEDSDVVWWETSESKILKSGETLVFWIKNGGNDDLTLEDFNSKFGTSLTAEQLIEISCGGMANSGARGVKIASNVKDVLDYVTYNMDGVDNTTADQSIVFKNQYTDGAFASVLTDDAATPTPGTVTETE